MAYVLTCRSVNNIVYILYKVFNNSLQYYDFVNLLFKYCTLYTVQCTVYSIQLKLF